ncbi:exonuclease SbcCD subunit D [Thioalkalivibrio sp.]|uniref:metallophosphoesterase family protein n=1 Tax=Thioalkalivibrio sp. TaxID=2093813 RepID=UPI0039749E7F
MGTFRFLHTADIHLDSPLRGLTGQEGSAAARIRSATREAFELLVGRAIAERVAFVVIAGDLYDGDWRDYRTGLFFAAQMGRLNAAGIPVFLLHGNHDAQSQITRRLELPDNVRVFGARSPETFRLEDIDVALHGQSFSQREIRDNLVPGYPEPVAGAFNIGVLHTGLGGMGGHENYAPCALAELTAKGYAYWALGHVHQFQILHRQPHVVFPGNLQGRHVRETGAKGAALVSVANGEVGEVAMIASEVVRWSLVPVAVDAAASVPEVLEAIRAGLEEAMADQAEGRLLACRVVLQGRAPMHGQLVGAEAYLLAEARAIALGLGAEQVWVERVKVATEPEVDARTLAARTDALGELHRMLAEASHDPDLLAQLGEDPGQMLLRLPHEVRIDAEADSALKAALEGDQRALISTVLPYLAARLTTEED